MNPDKAQRRIQRALLRLKPCPFCGRIPVVKAYHKLSGEFYGHFVQREGCCVVTNIGKTELFFTLPGKRPNFKLWWKSANMLINDWNRRHS